MASVDTVAASHPCLPCTPRAETTADGLGWLLYASAQAGWHQGGHGTTAAAMVEKCIWRLILLVFCEILYVVLHGVVVAENKLISTINHKMF
jgi:hypothetical protein